MAAAGGSKVSRLHRTVYAIGLLSIFLLSAFLVHTQTDAIQHITGLKGTSAWSHVSRYIGRNVSVSLEKAHSAQLNVPAKDAEDPAKQQVVDVQQVKMPPGQETKTPPDGGTNTSPGQQTQTSATRFDTGVPQTFELVEGISSNIYVYGALWNVNRVRLISIKKQRYTFRNLLCVLYYSEYKSAGVYVKPIIAELHTYRAQYISSTITCPPKPGEHQGEIPLFVGLVESPTATPKKTFFVENRAGKNKAEIEKAGYKFNFPEKEVTKEFTVCVPAMFGQKDAAKVVEKIEMTRLLGAGRVVLYNESVSSNVDAVLKMYTREWAEGRESLEVVVLPWHLPMESAGKLINIPYWAQQLAIDDCMYRYKRVSKYMVFTDLDEVLFPLQHANWSSLVAERRRLKPQSIGWLFRCTMVNKDRPSPAAGFENDVQRFGSPILGLTSRDVYVYPAHDRSKLIVDPTTIEEMGVHLIWSGEGVTDNLPVDVGLLFHYRDPVDKCRAQVKDTRVADRYGKRLVARLTEIWSKLKGVDLGWSPYTAGDRSKCQPPPNVGAKKVPGIQTSRQIPQQKQTTATRFDTGVPQTFELVEGISSNIYVYGALWNVNRVRLISIKKQRYTFRNLLCVLYYSEYKSAGVYVKPIIAELHSITAQYISSTITCPPKPGEHQGEIPLFVGLVESPTATPKKTFFVENRAGKNKAEIEKAGYKFNFPEKEVTKDFTVCVPAMFKFKDAAKVVEKIEMTRLLGAGRVVLYNASMSSNVDAVLKMYTREWAEGRESLEVVVLPWHLPMESADKPINIPYYAQQLAIDDCMYRYKRLSKYMVFTDLDEVLFPLKHANWSSLVAERRRLKPQSIGWLFRCTMVNKDRPSPAAGFENDVRRFGSPILGLTSRDVYVYPAHDRPKLIVDPTTIEEMGVHLIWSGEGVTDNLPVDVGLLFHYRDPIDKCRAQVKDTRVADRYGKRLVARLTEIWSKLKGVDLGWSPYTAGDRSKCQPPPNVGAKKVPGIHTAKKQL